MPGALRKTMVYLGLAEEDEHYDGYYDDAADADVHDTRDHGVAHHGVDDRDDRRAQVTPITRDRDRQVARIVSDPAPGDLSRITTIHPRTYNEAKTIGEAFREGVPVIMNLTDMDDSDAKRLVDFSAGLVFGLRGSIERVTSKVFLLSPAHVEVTAETPAKVRGVSANGFFNQS
ncbi:MAG TPA: cell division protein SepF [Actinomycetales bacterium]|nr:cell division protein SepF [Actinomycetales bacterium]